MKKIFSLISDIAIKRPKTILVACLIITIILGIFSANLKMELSWVGIAPHGDPSVKEYQDIIKDYPTMSNVFVVVSSEDKSKLDRAANLAEERLKQLDKYIYSVSSKLDEDFLIKHGLLLMDKDMIEAYGYYMTDTNLEQYLSNMNTGMNVEIDRLNKADLNKSDEKKKLLDGQDFFISSLRGMDSFLDKFRGNENYNQIDVENGVKSAVLGDPYMRSIDGKKLLISVQPSFDVMDYDVLVDGVNAIDNTLKELEKELTGIKYEITGMHIVGRDEMESVESDSTWTMIGGVILILGILYWAFRFKSAPILAFIPLALGVIWDIGLTAIIIGRLNLITAFTAIMLIGLGIDFSIHILSGYTEAISKGKEKIEAIRYAVEEVGPSVFTGALTTAAAFLTLTISSLELLKELGIVMGMGILTTLAAVMFVLPALLVLKKKDIKKLKDNNGEYKSIGKIAILSKRFSIITLSLIIVISGIAGWYGSKTEFDLNMMNLEPKGLDSVRVMQNLVKDFGMSSEGFLVKTDNLDEIYRLGKELKEEKGVGTVTSIADFIPENSLQEERLKKIKEMKALLDYQPAYSEVDRAALTSQLKELKSNIIEMKGFYVQAGAEKAKYIDTDALDEAIKSLQGNKIKDEDLNRLSHIFYNSLKQLSKDMMTDSKIGIKDLPENYRSQFVSKDESSYLLSVYPDFEMWESLNKDTGKEFLNMIREKNKDFTGTPLFMHVLFQAASKEAVKTIVIVFTTLFLIILLHFKSIKYTLMAFLPLAATILLTLGTMKLIGLKWNVLNVLALPLIIGIGVDDAVHILHRYRSGKDSIYNVFSSVGRAILLTSLTTMIGFGSLIFSSYTGMANLGLILFIGVGYAFITTVLLIPVLLRNRKAEDEITSYK